MPGCDWHNCAQCRNAHHVANVAAAVGRGDGANHAVIVTVVDHGMVNQRALVPEDAREIARQLLDSADRCEQQDWMDARRKRKEPT